MRWERLFADLEGQAAEERRQEIEAEVAERIRAERARITLLDRLAAHDDEVGLVLLTGRVVEGRVAEVGDGWAMITAARRRALVPVSAVVEVEGLGWSAAQVGRVSRRLGITHPLRVFARDRARVDIEDRLGRVVTGTIDAVGADTFELAEHPAHLPRRAVNVVAHRTWTVGGILCVLARD